MPKKKVYCGTKTPPKGFKLGTMKQCKEKNQLRRYGLLKVDSRVLNSTNKKADAKKDYANLMRKKVKQQVKVDKLRDKYRDYIRSAKDKQKARESKTAKDMKKRFEKEANTFNSLQKQIEKARNKK